MSMPSKSRLTLLAAPAVLVLALAGCSQKYSAERDGKKLGEAMCDVRTATNREDVTDATNEIKTQLNDLSNKYALYTAEDQRDIDKNVADLAEHAVQGNTALMQQDLAVLQRSAANIAEDSNEVGQAAWEGVQQGLTDCTE
jgi:hypothetical protein